MCAMPCCPVMVVESSAARSGRSLNYLLTLIYAFAAACRFDGEPAYGGGREPGCMHAGALFVALAGLSWVEWIFNGPTPL